MPLDLGIESFQGVGVVDLGAVSLREAHKWQHVGFSFLHEICELGELRAQLISHGAPLLAGGLEGLLGEGGIDRGENHLALALAGVGERVAQEVNATALPGRGQDLGGRPPLGLAELRANSMTLCIGMRERLSRRAK
jgi:hypothetical protein